MQPVVELRHAQLAATKAARSLRSPCRHRAVCSRHPAARCGWLRRALGAAVLRRTLLIGSASTLVLLGADSWADNRQAGDLHAEATVADHGPSTADLFANSADLPALLRTTLESHPAIRNQDQLRDAASAQVDAARRQFFPNPSISYERVEAAENDSVYRGNSQIGVVRLQQSLWTGGRLRGGLARARAARQLSDADMATVNLQLSLQVAGLWAEAQAAQAVVAALEQSRDIHRRLQDMVQRRVSGGASAVADAELARARLQLVESDLQGAAARRDSALERIRSISGDERYEPRMAGSGDYPQSIAEARVSALLEPALTRSPFIARARL
ncbi:MAG: TolC family protein, partial [Gammaproteobacteria bacterium]